MKQVSKNGKKTQKKKQGFNPLPIVAAVVIVAAALTVAVPKLTRSEPAEEQGGAALLSEDGGAVAVDTAELSAAASFYDYDADGTTVELFAVEASDGSIRLALNTCQVCNGSPYAYFVQDGDYFICQNCRNRFASTQVGLVSGGCNPVPITEENYSVQDGKILISAEFLKENAVRFANWKKF